MRANAHGDADGVGRLLDSLTDIAVYSLNSKGFITSWNLGAETLEGYESQQAIGNHFSQSFTPEDRAKGVPDSLLEEAKTSGRAEVEGWRLRKDGSRFWASTIIHPIRDRTGKVTGYSNITRDITQRMQAQEALRESERRFRLLVEGAVDYSICMLDQSGTVTSWNAGGERVDGYTADEILGRHFSRFFTPEDRKAGVPVRALETAAREGRYETEGWHVRKDGGRYWASVVIETIHDSDGKLLGYGRIVQDITERRAAQMVLRESERQFRFLVTSVRDYAIYMLDPNGVVTSWNAGAQRIKGYAADEILGQHFSLFYTAEDRAAGAPMETLRIAEREGRFETEARRVRKDGSLFWAHIVVQPILDDEGDLIGFAKVTRDITEKRNSEIALKDAQAERAQVQKMEALSQLTGSVAHDFNNLLMLVSSHLRILKKHAPEDERATAAMEGIDIAVKRGAALTRQLMTFSKRQVLNPRPTNVVKCIESVSSLVSGSLGTANLAIGASDGVWEVQVDPNEFELALMNLVLNARDAMPDGGTISIDAENAVLDGRLSGLMGDYVVVTVRDVGAGIPADVLPKVFDPFFSTKPADKGSGLGLSQVYGFAQQSGGTVTIKSEVGNGTTVSLYLPRAGVQTVGRSTLDVPPAESSNLVPFRPRATPQD